ncbi:glycosyltransferase family 4 protein [Porticoccaceae bacterium]|nr:glycosyltransferase family 4 protein [Porticoccaceae bacterium]
MIIVNARFLTQKITGVQRYAIELCRQLKKNHTSLRFVAPRNVIHEELANELEVERCGYLEGHLWEQIELPRYASNCRNALIVNLCNTAPLFYRNKLVVLHDVAFKRFPKNFSFLFRNFYRVIIPWILRNSKYIVTDSEFSKNEIYQLYNLGTKPIKVIPCAVGDNFKNISHNKRNYVLAVSSISPHKNFGSLVKAFASIDEENIELHIVGDINKNFSDAGIVDLIKSNSKIKMLGHITDSELAESYTKALCFVYPSFYEGFGIPPLEAQASGCPCIVSDIASLPEVFGESVVYCDPYSISDIASKLKNLISDDKVRKKYIRLGLDNVKRYSYRRSAIEMIELIEGSK